MLLVTNENMGLCLYICNWYVGIWIELNWTHSYSLSLQLIVHTSVHCLCYYWRDSTLDHKLLCYQIAHGMNDPVISCSFITITVFTGPFSHPTAEFSKEGWSLTSNDIIAGNGRILSVQWMEKQQREPKFKKVYLVLE